MSARTAISCNLYKFLSNLGMGGFDGWVRSNPHFFGPQFNNYNDAKCNFVNLHVLHIH